MCKVQKLRELLNERLAAAVEEIRGLFERTVAVFEEELHRTKDEVERQRQLLDASFRPQVWIEKADVQHWSSRVEQEEPLHVIEKEECHVKSEEDDEEQAEWSQLYHGEEETSRHAAGDHHGGARIHPSQRLQPHGDTTAADTHQSDTNHPKSAILHPDEALFVCRECGKTFSQRSSLQRHAGHHAGDKPFSCVFCSQTFRQRSLLERHTRAHTGEKPFSCSLCDSTFSRRNGLEDHMRIHTGEKPFSCSLCHSRFTKRYTLVLHMRTHTGEKPFSCRMCGKAFSQQGVMRTHMRTHTGEKPFSCSACERRFARKYQLERHHCMGPHTLGTVELGQEK
ncbi:zinc finger protein OZF-like [Dunckerocampus dactyliophorus]|uniref:zinc finger protein OZF-like n=1 Tax=Dunckerocampus dactyliophorus TaxID=161453 RepID=UPI002405AB59|nr:zinc finger protein OZF-like [Dunckerocampus dactyliophorus]